MNTNARKCPLKSKKFRTQKVCFAKITLLSSKLTSIEF